MQHQNSAYISSAYFSSPNTERKYKKNCTHKKNITIHRVQAREKPIKDYFARCGPVLGVTQAEDPYLLSRSAYFRPTQSPILSGTGNK